MGSTYTEWFQNLVAPLASIIFRATNGGTTVRVNRKRTMSTPWCTSARVATCVVAKLPNGDVDFTNLEDQALVSWKDVQAQVHREMGDLEAYKKLSDNDKFNVATATIQLHQFLLCVLRVLKFKDLNALIQMHNTCI